MYSAWAQATAKESSRNGFREEHDGEERHHMSLARRRETRDVIREMEMGMGMGSRNLGPDGKGQGSSLSAPKFVSEQKDRDRGYADWTSTPEPYA